MARVQANGIELEYDSFGSPKGRPLLLIMGLGGQMIMWDEGFCEALAARGHYVVRFDNRDVGLSTKLGAAGVPNVMELMMRGAAGSAPQVPYTLDDMADDAAGLLDALGVERAHVVGGSLGGMVAQLLVIRHPDRVLSLASLMSTTGRRGQGRTSVRVWRHLLSRPPRTEEEAIERRVRVFATVGSRGFEQDVEELRRVTALAMQRDPDARAGRRRQHRAVRRAGDRTEALRRITAPTVVIHGTDDRMCHPSGGHATASAVPSADLVLIPGMGHDLPPGAWTQLIDAIVRNARRPQTPDDNARIPRPDPGSESSGLG